MAPLTIQSPDKEYNNSMMKKEDIAYLRKWLTMQPHLPEITDLDIMLVLHSCEYSLEMAKSVIDMNWTLRTHFTGIFNNPDAFEKGLLKQLNVCLYKPLSVRTPEGYRVIYCRATDYDPKNYHFADSVKAFMMVVDLLQLEEGTWPGFVIMIDLQHIVLGHLAKLDVMTIRQTLYYLQEAMPVRLKALHFLNTPPFMDKLLLMLRPFMKRELLAMLHLHPPPASDVYDLVPRRAFPMELGGEEGDFDTIKKELIQRLQDNSSLLLDRAVSVDESQRPGKPKSLHTLFGMEGSFKKLDID